ncbi:LysR family transcriptional regulator [Alphaproteobacteria bacterium KMM 3653]|uniref:LysR family transcriptional regulator n=1 Tax=Harenicola maris TaxID=2841044 RepID=A0AAP2CS25_9RHOB|nr:LysR family transcriptional regulator [Harenicola maris]
MNDGIDLRRLRYFVCLADELHFGRAAERLGIAQAPLSQQIKLLEERLGVKLFNRTTRRTQLTAAGETLLRHSEDLLEGLDRAVAHTRATAGESTGRIVVGGVHLAMSHIIPPIIAEFRKTYPAVVVEAIPIGTSQQLRRMADGEVDVAFIRPSETAAFMQMETLSSEGFVAVLPKGHPLTAKEELTLRDFDGEWMVGYAPVLGAYYSNIVLSELHRAGISPRIVMKCTHTTAIATQVASGLGVAIVPSWITTVQSPFLEYRAVPELPKAVDMAVAWPTRETSLEVLEFVATARRVCKGANLFQSFG